MRKKINEGLMSKPRPPLMPKTVHHVAELVTSLNH
jgi:hypothetical protein